MFRTSRAFLLAAPAAFGVALVAFLLTHPKAPEAFAAYPFMTDALGPGVVRHAILRFTVTSAAFFVPPYLVIGLLLFLSEVGLGAATPLWSGKRKGREAGDIPPESRWAFLGFTLALAAWAGVWLHRVANGGELPGGVNIAPLFVVAVSVGAVGVGLVAALVVATPRAIFRAQRPSRKHRAT